MNVKTRNRVNLLIHHDGYLAVKNNDMTMLTTARNTLISLLKDSEELKATLCEFDRTMYYYYNIVYCL